MIAEEIVRTENPAHHAHAASAVGMMADGDYAGDNARCSVRFYLNGRLHEVQPASPTQTLLQYLREQVYLLGTKEGCAEGDCGACTVMQATLEAGGQGGERVVLRSINACIRFLSTFDGKAIWTVEGLAREDRLHPVQQAMIDHHGSQCGFCTPGFVMSLYTLYQNGDTQPERDTVLDCLSGNLCRCTGYRPIIDAAQHMGDYGVDMLDLEQVAAQLQQLRQLRQQQAQASCASLHWQHNGQQYFAPRSADELAACFEDHPDAVILAGGTDVGLWVTKQLRTLPTLIYLGDIAELQQIERTPAGMRIGASVLLNDGYAALAGEYPEVRELWKRFASMPIRNSGTLVGNVANGSPIGDSAPWLIAAGAKVGLRKGQRRRELALEALYLDYRKQDREPGEFVEYLLVPWRGDVSHIATYKLSKRFDQDISAVCSACALWLDNDGRVADIRIAYGGMAATSKRAVHAERALQGQRWDASAVQQAMQALAQDYQPMTDMRASGAYRLKAAQNLLYRFYLENSSTEPTRV